MSTANEVGAVVVDAALAGMSMELAAIHERRPLDLAMDARHQAGEVLSREEVLAEFDKTDAALTAWREKILASIK